VTGSASNSFDNQPPPTDEELEAAFCWEREDEIPRRPEMTAFRRRTRLQQARWRERHGHPVGSQPIAPKGKPSRPVGSRMPLDYARETGANFVTPNALVAARERTSAIEPHQSIDHQRIWADLLWSPAVAFNVFGDLAADRELAARAVKGWWPDVPGRVTEMRFEHSPGWLDPAYLNSLRSFDAVFLLERGVVAVDVKYHERAKAEKPKPENLTRNVEVAEKSQAFAPGAIDRLTGRSDLAVMWLEHLLLLSMLQHEGGSWSWGRYVVVYPAGNSDMTGLCSQYRELLADESTFATMTLEALLESSVLPAANTLRERYLAA
jgi:PD-(D/E)XK nuclease superfamily protein